MSVKYFLQNLRIIKHLIDDHKTIEVTIKKLEKLTFFEVTIISLVIYLYSVSYGLIGTYYLHLMYDCPNRRAFNWFRKRYHMFQLESL